MKRRRLLIELSENWLQEMITVTTALIIDVIDLGFRLVSRGNLLLTLLMAYVSVWFQGGYVYIFVVFCLMKQLKC